MWFFRAHSRKIIYVAFMAAAISAAFSMALLYSTLSQKPKKTNNLLHRMQQYTPKEDKTQFNVLLLGYGGAGHPGGGLADAIILVNINTKTKNVNLISIPRDSWVELPVRSDQKQFFKINAAYAIGNDDNGYPLKEPVYKGPHGGGNMAKYEAELITGIPVDYYASIDFSRFEKAIDTLGGVSVDVPVSFSDEYYPIKGEENNLCDYSLEEVENFKALYSGFELEKQFKCRYETLSFQKGPTEMDGATALKFVRSRHSNEHGGDFARGERAQAVLTAAGKKLISLDALSNLDEFYAGFSQIIKTDITEDGLVEILSYTRDPSQFSLKNININENNFLTGSTSSDGQSIVIPKAGIGAWQEVHKFIKSELK